MTNDQKTKTNIDRARLGRSVLRFVRRSAAGPRLGALLFGLLLGAVLFGIPWCGDGPPARSANSHSAPAPEEPVWTCAMHPQIRKSAPGDCPICGMDLVPVTSVSSRGEAGPARVKLSPRALKLAELRTTKVVRRHDESEQVRLLGRVAPNEETLKNITAWIGGRIDRLFVNTTGQRVTAGQRVASLYSPEVYSAHQDLIVATAQLERMRKGSESARRAAEAALEAARQRLSLLGVPADEVARMQKQTQPTTSVAVRSPFSGTVMERFATEGSYVTTGTRLYSIANLKSLWIELDAYESDLALLSKGQRVDVQVEAYPGESFSGKIAFIDPTVDQRLRTSKIRVEVDNDDGRLRPGMFAQAIVAAKEGIEGAPLVIPASAPLFTGRRAIVYVEVPGNDSLLYEARAVRLGPRLGESYPVVAGLAEGERVVTRGAFALDADLQIKGGRSMMMSPDDSEPGMWDDVVHLPAARLRPLRDVMSHYLSIQRALAEDELGPAKQNALSLRATLAGVDLDHPDSVAKTWSPIEGMLAGGSQHIAQADSLEQARIGFEHLSGAVIMLLRTFGNPMDSPLSLAHCPMARGSRGANWIQSQEEIENSYFGESMRSCGDIQELIDPGAHLKPPRSSKSAAAHQAEGHDH